VAALQNFISSGENIITQKDYGRKSLLNFVMSQNLATAEEKEILILFI
jgi:hypothetical protein